MAQSAKLTSIDAVRKLAVALRRYIEDAGSALSELDMEVNRALQWIDHDRKEYWHDQVRRGMERVAGARANLERKMICRVDDQRSSQLDEKKALDQEKHRLEQARDKTEIVRQWARTIHHEAIEYRGNVNHLAGFLQLDLPRAIALLTRMSRALESYVAVAQRADTAVDWTKVMNDAESRLEEAAAGTLPDTAADAPSAASPAGAEAQPSAGEEEGK
jgi:hypothetical protein